MSDDVFGWIHRGSTSGGSLAVEMHFQYVNNDKLDMFGSIHAS